MQTRKITVNYTNGTATETSFSAITSLQTTSYLEYNYINSFIIGVKEIKLYIKWFIQSYSIEEWISTIHGYKNSLQIIKVA